MSELLSDLKAVRKLLEAKNRWTKRSFAKNKGGVPVTPEEPDAVCWCLAGAIQKVASSCVERRWGMKDILESELRRHRVLYRLVEYNDAAHRRHKDIIGLLDRTIKRVEG